jgi:hypothetical protein
MPARIILISLLLAAAAAIASNRGVAAEEFAIAGTYVQKRVCRGDGSDPKRLVVVIATDEIKYGGGTCMLTEKHVEGETLSARATCKFRSGRILSSNITLTKRADNNVEMVDPEGAYNAVLYRCPGQ